MTMLAENGHHRMTIHCFHTASIRMVSAVKRKSIDSSAVDNEDGASSGDAGKTSKKPRSSNTTSCPSTSSTAGAASASPATKEDQQTKLLSQLRVGSRIEVWWTGDKKYYPATVASGIPGGGKYEYFVHYDDGDHQYLDLREEQFRMIKGDKSSRAPSSLIDSDLVVPDEVDTSKLPEGWEKIVRTELKACGLGADEEYRRQLEEYDSSDDDAGEPPTPPPTRKRMGRDRAAVHYKTTQVAAGLLMKIVDMNLERAGISTSRSNFTEDDDRLIKSLYETELKASGNECARNGFWGEVAEQHFAGRGLTARVISDRYSKFIVKKSMPRSDDKHDPSSRKRFTDADFKLMAELVQKELKETNGDRVRYGFWGEVVEDHFAGRGFTAVQLRDHYKKNKKPRINEREEITESVSGDHFTDAEDTIIREAVAQHKREHGSDKLPCGFWPGVIEAHSMKRDARQLARRWYYLKQTGGATLKAGIDIRNGEEEKTALPGGFTDEEYLSIERLVREELKVTGSERVRPGFWEGVLQKSFSGRNMTSKALCNLYSKIKLLKMAEKPAAADDHMQKTKSSHGEYRYFTAEEDEAIITEAVKETRDHGKLRSGFWPKVVEKHSLNRTTKQLSNRWSILKSNEEVDVSVSPSSDSEAANSDRSDQRRNNRNAESGTEAPDGPSKFSDEDDRLMERLVKEELKETGTGKVRLGFWRKVLDEHFSGRDFNPKNLSSRFFYLKSKGKIEMSATTSSEIELAASEPRQNHASDAKDETIGSEVAIRPDTAPLTDDLIVLPAYQATAAKYPPQSRVIYSPSSGESGVFGSVVKVGIYPDQDNLYVYTIADDAGDHYERIPERFLEKMR